MSKIVFKNQDKKAIKLLLREIGKERYEIALKDADVLDMKPITMSGFYVVWDDKDVHLYYRYPSGTEVFIMDVLGFWNVPKKGWELIRDMTK